MRISSKLLVATAAAGLVATAGTAFTASNTLNGKNVAGYGTAVVSGASTSAIQHTLNATGDYVASTSLTFSNDLVAATVVKAGFGGTLVSCTVTHVAVATGPDTAECTYAATQFLTSSANDFSVVAN